MGIFAHAFFVQKSLLAKQKGTPDLTAINFNEINAVPRDYRQIFLPNFS